MKKTMLLGQVRTHFEFDINRTRRQMRELGPEMGHEILACKARSDTLVPSPDLSATDPSAAFLRSGFRAVPKDRPRSCAPAFNFVKLQQGQFDVTLFFEQFFPACGDLRSSSRSQLAGLARATLPYISIISLISFRENPSRLPRKMSLMRVLSPGV